ncbi:hypothetical protein [Oleiharenicola sp. Vm1]|uniref:hypothetical protein n=1 Tax=Oleiharenicola sp. Vm1 TaxID=3398393 RepID=UPI0039F5E1D8
MKPLRQFWALAQLWIAVALRLRAGWAVGAAAVALVAGGALVRELHFGSAEAGFLVDYAAGVVAAGGAVLAALVGPALFFEGCARTRRRWCCCTEPAGAPWRARKFSPPGSCWAG